MNVFLIISISTILVILILLLRYLIVSIEDLKAQNDKVTYIADIVDRIDDNITPKTKIKAKNSSKKSE